MGRVHIQAQNMFLSFRSAVFPLYLTWYTTDTALLGPEAQLYQHLRKNRSSISLTCLPFRNIFCKLCIVNIQIHFTVNNYATASLLSKRFWAGTERRKGEMCWNTLRWKSRSCYLYMTLVLLVTYCHLSSFFCGKAECGI